MNSTLRKSPAGACFSLTALSMISILILCFGANSVLAQQNPQYGTFAGCANMSLGTPTSGPGGGSLNGFLPFTADNPWNTNIANAPVDPNSAAIIGAYSATTPLHANFGNGIGGIPYIVVDSTITKPQPIFLYNLNSYGSTADIVVSPYPENVPVEGLQPACSDTWPEHSHGDSHAFVLDRATCWLYETWSTNTCNGMSEAQVETVWDMTSADQRRPWGWVSADTAGLSLFAGLVRYEEANSGVINHAIRFTMEPGNIGGDANGGYFVLPATHGGSNNTTPYLMPFGTRLRLKAGTPPPGDGPINMAIYTALQQYGMILADRGGDLMITGDNDERWNMGQLGALGSITLGDFEVVQMTPEYPGMDPVTAFTDYPGNPPTISSFTATDSNGNALDNVQPGDAITFNYAVSGDSYDYIDNIGPIRLSNGTGSITITPTATQEYTLYSTNASGRATPQSIWIVMPSAPMTAPVFVPPGGLTSASTLNVAILPSSISESNVCLSNCSTPTNASFQTGTIYYTTDGSTPTTDSTVFVSKLEGTGSLLVTPPMTVNAIVVTTVNGVTQTSAMGSAVYTPGTAAAAPVFSPVPSTTYYGPQSVTISDTTPGATMYYTTDGSLPVYPIAGSTQQYTGPFVVQTMPGYTPPGVAASKVPEIVQAIAVAPGYANSANTTATYNFGPAPTPTFSPGNGTYSGAQTVSISAVPGASIYYTITPGSTGTPPSMYSTLYTNPIVVATNEVVDAIAIASGYEQSATGISKYIMAAADKPIFSPVTGGTYYGPQSVTISDTTPGATIYYTTDGTTPTYPITGTTQQYTGSINVSVTETVKAIVVAYGYSNSAGSALYTLKANAPTLSLVAGTYFGPQSVTISDTTSGATIYYTTDGTTPTYPITGTTQQYTGSINVSVTETVKAIAGEPGYTSSAVATAVYTLKVAPPSFTPGAGTYTSIQTVTISDTTPGATIYYTTNGTTPTTASAVYSTSTQITVSASQTLEAIGVLTGFTNSATTIGAYTIHLPAAAVPSFSPVAATYTGAQTVTISDTTTGATMYYTTDGTTPTYPITGTTQQYTGSITVSTTETLKAIAAAYNYANSAVKSGTYTIN